ncbi:GNAT family protein [soil metagenome]
MRDGEAEEFSGTRLVSGRLMLRRPVPADAAAVTGLAADKVVAENLCSAISSARGGSFVITDRADGTVLGCAGFGSSTDLPTAVEVAAWICFPYWGRGLGNEASQALIDHAFADGHVSLLWCSNRVTNTRARRVIEKCGFQFRGTGMVRSPTFFGAFPVERFILDRRNWTSLKAWGAPAVASDERRHETAA